MCLALATGLLAIDLLLSWHWMMALAYAGLAFLWLRARARLLPRRPDAPRRLLLTADGRLVVFRVDGGVETATPAAESQWLGNLLLLVLQMPNRRYSLFFGDGNLDPAEFATLRRRLRGAQAQPSSGVDC